MLFSSSVFLFLFLPGALGFYLLFFLPYARGGRPIFRTLSNAALLLLSLFFYAWGEPWFVLVMLLSIAVNFACGLAMAKAEGDGARAPIRRLALVVSLVVSLGILAFFKYFDFAVGSGAALAGLFGVDASGWGGGLELLLPLGISFYTFQSLSYTIDVYRGQVRATRSFIDFACYVAMFPQLIAGPIVRYRDVAEQLLQRALTVGGFASGVRRFVIGLGKKMLIANSLAVPADAIFAIPADQLTTPLTWLGACCYTLQIYFDFSGYSDMAIGLGRMFGFEFPENFRYPYVARSIREFWRRWHISLSTWFRDYLYLPLGGNRGSQGRTLVNLVMVFFLCGLWHGASWTFVVWGLFHGLFLVIERLGFGVWLERRPRVLAQGYTLLVVIIGWVAFRADDLGYTLAFLAGMAGFAPGDGLEYPVAAYLANDVLIALAAGVLFSLPVVPWLRAQWQRLAGDVTGISPALEAAAAVFRVTGIAAILVACGMLLSAGTHNPFIYFRF